MKVFRREQLAALDRFTIEREPVAEIDLMERASMALADWLLSHRPVPCRIAFFAGMGNNGGDAMAVARMVAAKGYSAELFLPLISGKRTEASQINLDRIFDQGRVPVTTLSPGDTLPDLSGFDFLVDGLWGSGLNRPVTGFAAGIIEAMNGSGREIISIDLPSGLYCDENNARAGAVVCATHTLTLELPKLALFFAENERYFGRWHILPFGLHAASLAEMVTPFRYFDSHDARSLLKSRSLFAHKGSFGQALLLAGSKGKYGAALLAARAVLRSGAGLLTVHLPGEGVAALNVSLPEAMTSADNERDHLSLLPDITPFSGVAIGPGIGKDPSTLRLLVQLIREIRKPLVVDADGLNLLAEHPELLSELPAQTILTPHPGEFDRLAGLTSQNEEERLGVAITFATSYHIILVLKGAFTRVIFPDGSVSFNSTGNPGMATGGTGDVLTGIILGLLAQGYLPHDATRLGVFLHGLSADLQVASGSMESLLAGEIADGLVLAFAALKSK
ncbi:MAG: NAD(P)H-hydrate dehydratase [Marinilabiliales bacterium]|nr:NAD(P)H-hydrate dehydratase [Marinilabiliales bacterium]